ncbi:MAG: hypothetical protein KDB25_02120 [Leucobacter sp.]|nr:hypothetical protein [Leucobacter sp.]
MSARRPRLATPLGHRLRPAIPLARGGAARRQAQGERTVQLVQRATALLRGGISANRLWRVLLLEAGPGPPGTDGDASVQRIAQEIARGEPGADALAAGGLPEWRVLAAVWRLAEWSGAPLVPTLERFGRSLHELEQLSARRSVLLAAPRSTIRLVAVLPPAALLLGTLFGFDPWQALGDPLAVVAIIAGAIMLVIGVRWAGALTRRVAAADWVAGWEFELVAIAISGGIPPGAALRSVVDCADRARAEWVKLAELSRDGAVPRAIAAAESLGAPIGPMLLGEAEARRDRARTELEGAAERLGIGVLIPIGVCVLPAFILLGVVPVLVAMMRGAGLG